MSSKSQENHQVVHSATRASLGLGTNWHPGTTFLQNLKRLSASKAMAFLSFSPEGLGGPSRGMECQTLGCLDSLGDHCFH